MGKKSKGYIDLKTVEGRQKFYQTKEWKTIRLIVLQRNPFCVECKKNGINILATEVDHIEDIKDAPERILETDNLQGLCKKCHAKKTFDKHRYIKPTYTQVNKKWQFSQK